MRRDGALHFCTGKPRKNEAFLRGYFEGHTHFPTMSASTSTIVCLPLLQGEVLELPVVKKPESSDPYVPVDGILKFLYAENSNEGRRMDAFHTITSNMVGEKVLDTWRGPGAEHIALQDMFRLILKVRTDRARWVCENLVNCWAEANRATLGDWYEHIAQAVPRTPSPSRQTAASHHSETPAPSSGPEPEAEQRGAAPSASEDVSGDSTHSPARSGSAPRRNAPKRARPLRPAKSQESEPMRPSISRETERTPLERGHELERRIDKWKANIRRALNNKAMALQKISDYNARIVIERANVDECNRTLSLNEDLLNKDLEDVRALKRQCRA